MVQRLQDSQQFAPQDLRNVSACIYCRLIMQENQWNKKSLNGRCPNCDKDASQRTKEFTGMISVIIPEQSWVARYNHLERRMPGLYATKLLETLEGDYEEGLNPAKVQDEEDDMKDFIVGDNEIE